MVRIHSRIAAAPAWIKIWYIARALDLKGSGRVQLPVHQVIDLINQKLPTIYEWLRDAKSAGAIRCWKIASGVLTVYYTSLPKLTHQLGLQSWGAVSSIDLTQIKNLRTAAVEAETQSQQDKSSFAARKALSNPEAKSLNLRSPESLVEKDDEPWCGASLLVSSLKPDFIFRGIQRVFVGEDFVPFGASQVEIAQALGLSDRTIRRHQVGTTKKQLVQTKPGYQYILGALEHGLDSGGTPKTYVTNTIDGLRLYETNGATSATREGGHPIHQDRFFEYFGHAWIYRCNLYSLQCELHTMKYAKLKFEKLIAKNRQTVAAGGVVADKKKLSNAGRQSVSATVQGGV